MPRGARKLRRRGSDMARYKHRACRACKTVYSKAHSRSIGENRRRLIKLRARGL